MHVSCHCGQSIWEIRDDDFWVEEAKLTASDGTPENRFGHSVSISGDWAVMGAYLDGAGSAYAFRRDDNGTPSDPSDDFWVEQPKLTASDAGLGDHFGFGWSVSISGDRIVMGAVFGDDVCPSDPSCNSGSAYVFRRDDNGTPSDPGDDLWIEEAKLTASDAEAGDRFGFSVSTTGDRAIVGIFSSLIHAPAYVFRRDDNDTPSDPVDDFWVEERKLTELSGASQVSVSMSGDRIVMGLPLSSLAFLFRLHDNATPTDPSDDSWIPEAWVQASDTGTDFDLLGFSVSISGDRAIVGAMFDDDAGTDSGSAYVFPVTATGIPCNDGDACTENDTCSEAMCVGTPHCQLYGDVFPPGPPQGNCAVDIDDILLMLAAFADPDPCANFPGTNLFPCDQPCEEGAVDIDDILAVLAAFSGNPGCPDPCL